MNIELKDFLKKYSTIPESFIDEFYEIQISKNITTEFKINLDLVVKWLHARKDSLKETIVNSYIKNVDYTITQQINKGRGGTPKDIIMLTNSTFKRLCMLSKSKKAETVRTYFISLENLVDKYKDHIIASMEMKIKQLENNQKPKVNPQSGLLYVIKTDKDIDDMYKIGKSVKFKKRLISHNSSHSDDVEVVLVYETKDQNKVEDCLKALLKDKQYRKRKEVYQVDIDIIKDLLKGCDDLQLMVKNKSNKFKQDGGYFIMLLPK